MDLSLDEIIKRKKFVGNPSRKRGNFNQQKPLKAISKPSRKIIDARNKIIAKKRAKIHDARERLLKPKITGDARQKLQKRQNMNLRTSRLPKTLPRREIDRKRKIPIAAMAATKYPILKLPSVPRGYVDYDNMDEMDIDPVYDPSAITLRRTIHNDISASYNPYGGSSSTWNTDPFDCYEIPINRPPDVSEPMHLHRQIRNVSPDVIQPKSILRTNQMNSSYGRRFIPDESSHLSYEMRTRLERAPDPHASMGIFANPLKPPSSSTGGGYRIVVSNLHSSVTQSDIKELFEDIGELYEARLVRPGVAEVIFKSLKDAEKAVDTYHNRQLDGQPMKCLLVNPRASNKPTDPAIKTSGSQSSSKSSGKTPLEIDIDALHKVLFRRT